jgi:hypothetical protein
MRSCWIDEPEQRPSFDKLRKLLTGIIERNHPTYGYVQATASAGKSVHP